MKRNSRSDLSFEWLQELNSLSLCLGLTQFILSTVGSSTSIKEDKHWFS